MAKISQHAQRAIDAHTAYERRCKDDNTCEWLERQRIARGMLGKRSLWCGNCGQTIARPIKGADQEGNIITCPHCGRKLKLQNIACKHSLECYQELVAIGDYQCIRVWFIEQYYHKGQEARIGFFHVYDEMWSKNGNRYIFSTPLGYTGSWNVWNPFSKNDCGLRYHARGGNQFTEGWRIDGSRVRSVTDWARQRELHKHHCGETDWQRAFAKLAEHDAFAETLWKADSDLFYEYTYTSTNRQTKAAIKIAWRHGWKNWERSWFDHIHNIIELGLDYRNPHYICPADFNAAHTQSLAQVVALRERQWKQEQEERRIRKLKEAEALKEAYAKFIAKFADVSIKVGDVIIRPLLDIEAFAEEGKAMHHCVFAAEYYKKANCLILSARVGDERKETIEVDTARWEVLQVHGHCNQNSDRHDIVVKAMQDWCNQQRKAVRHA